MPDFKLGEIKNPLQAVSGDKSYGGLLQDNGPISLLGNAFRLVAVAAGLFSLINFVMAGMQYIGSQGDPKQTEQAWQKIYMSFIGLAIVVLSFIVAAIIGQIFFGDASFILSPKIYGPGVNSLPK